MFSARLFCGAEVFLLGFKIALKSLFIVAFSWKMLNLLQKFGKNSRKSLIFIIV